MRVSRVDEADDDRKGESGFVLAVAKERSSKTGRDSPVHSDK